MPNIPTFDNDVAVRPGGAAEASPSAFAAPGRALAQGAAQFSDTMQAFNQRYADARRSADAAHQTAQGSEVLGDIQHKWSLVADRDQAQAGFDTDAAAARKKLLDGISDPLVQSHVSQQFDSEVISRRYDTANAAFRLESSTRRATMDGDLNSLANGAAAATNDALRAKLVDNGVATIKGAVAAGWLDPETGEKAELNFKSQVQEVQARSQMNAAIDAQDGAAAHDLSQRLSDTSQFPGLLPERREILQTRLENLGYRLDTRAASQQAHEDTVAERNLRLTQGRNEAVLLAGVNNGKALSDAEIEHLAATGQITAGGVEALHSAKNRAEDGHDSPDVTLRLWHAIGEKQAQSGDIFDALHAGQISKSTSVSMMRSLDASASKQANADAKAAFEQVKTVLHGGAIEQGFVPDKAPEVAQWAQAQGEWHRRVTIGGEDPNAVRDDMLKRYGANTAAPSYLDQPKLGIVQSSQDLESVIAKTGAARKAGKINDADYQAQLKLLSQYKAFYGLQPKPPAPAKPRGTP